MSATTERLLEQIKQAEHSLAEARALGQDPANITTLEVNLTTLRARLSQANEALTEGKQILKG